MTDYPRDCVFTNYCGTTDMRLEKASTSAGPLPRWRFVEDRVCCLPARAENTMKKCEQAPCNTLPTSLRVTEGG